MFIESWLPASLLKLAILGEMGNNDASSAYYQNVSGHWLVYLIWETSKTGTNTFVKNPNLAFTSSFFT